MYVSGTLANYENRLHQLPSGSGDLAQFYSEYQSLLPLAKYTAPYATDISGNPSGNLFYFSGKWTKEGIKKDLEFNTHYWSGYRYI